MGKAKSKNNSSKSKLIGKVVETITIGEIEFKLLCSGILPRLGEAENERLNESIAETGVQVPILVDEDYNVIDGEHRLRAAAKNNAKSIPFDVRPGLTDEEKMQLMLDLNLNRRHLSAKQLDQLIVKFRSEGRSLRQIGENLGISYSTVRRKLESSSVSSETVELPEKIIGKDNKKRNAKGKPKRKPSINVNTLKELNRAVDACNTAGSGSLPQKNIALKRLERIARVEEKKRLQTKKCSDFRLGDKELWFGDFRNKCKEIADSSVSVIFTDPPYSKDSLPLFDDVGRVAARLLKPSGLFISYSGVLYLPQVQAMLGKHLQYRWMAAISHSGGKKLVQAVKVNQAWKPILIYQKPPLKNYWQPFTDMVSGGQSKTNHEWEQAVDEAVHYIEALCPRNGVLLDPMMGSGTSILAALKCGVKKCIGIDNDPAAYTKAKERIDKFKEEMKNDAA